MIFIFVESLLALLNFVHSLDLKELTVNGDSCSLSCNEYQSSGIYKDYTRIILSGITELLGGTFRSSISVIEIILCPTIFRIEEECFKGCRNLTYIEIPNGVSHIYRETFMNCQNLRNITFPISLKFIQSGNTFNKCIKIEKFIVKKGNTVFSTMCDGKLLVENGIIARCWSGAHSKITIPDGIETLCNLFISGISTVKEIEFSKSSDLKYISDTAFYQAGFSEIRFPNGTETLGSNLLLETYTSIVHLPNTLTKVSNTVFSGMYNLQKVIIDEGCTVLHVQDSGVILDMNKTSVIYFPKSTTQFQIELAIQNVDTSVIRKCQKLTNLKTAFNHTKYYAEGNALYQENNRTLIANSGGNTIVEVIEQCEEIADTAFEGSLIQRVTFRGNNFRKLGSSVFINCWTLTHIELPNGTTDIGSYCFMKTGLTHINFPCTIVRIHHHAFSPVQCSTINLSLCTSLQEIKASTFYRSSKLEVVILGPNIKLIDSSCFAECKMLKNISIPSSVLNLGKKCFADSALSKIFFEADSQLEVISDSCFANTQLSEIDIPDSVLLLGKESLSNCQSLSSVRFNENSRLTTIEAGAISGSNKINYLFLGPNVTEIKGTALSEAYGLSEIAISKDNKNFETRPAFVDKVKAYKNCIIYTKYGYELVVCPGAIEKVQIGSDVSNIRGNAFYRCKNLKTVIFNPESPLRSIGAATFYGCVSITELSLPLWLETIESEAFSGCSELTTVTFAKASKLNEIQKKAFISCIKLIRFEYPSNLTIIGERAFEGCVSLEEINLPKSLTEIGSKSFSGCSRLSRAYACITEEKTGFSDNAFSECDPNFIFIVSMRYKQYDQNPTVCGMPALRILDGDCRSPTVPFTIPSSGVIDLWINLINCECDPE